MGAFTKTFTPTADCIVTESYIYSPVELHTSKDVKRVKIARTLWDTGASCSLVSERIAKLLNLEPIGKTGVIGFAVTSSFTYRYKAFRRCQMKK